MSERADHRASTTTAPATLPQRATDSDAVVGSVEWLFEPAWKGTRLMARIADGRVSLTDDEGGPAGRELDEVGEVLAPMIDADAAVIDGVWTNMPFVGEGSAARHLADAIAEEGLEEEVPDPIENEPRRAFVAVDLVELDGQPLHDVPYLERRRLLASVVEENVRVRLSPAVRLPIHNWLIAWRANGFAHYIAKHVNSRYRPGEVADDWLRISTRERRGPNPIGRLFGVRPKKVVHIDDASEEGPQPPRR
jgi:bifunctional non-homologous end joining protein LigD